MNPPKLDRLRTQRDRFLAFAFCGADVLIEINDDNRVSYSLGRTQRYFGEPPEALENRSFQDLTYPPDALMMVELLKRLRQSGRLERVRVQLRGKWSEPIPATLSGIILPNAPESVYLTINRASFANATTDTTKSVAEGTEDFAALAQRRIRQAAQSGETYELTLINLSEAINDLPRDKAKTFMENAEANMRAWSIDGASVGKLDNTKFGVIHERGVAASSIQQNLKDMASAFDAYLNVAVDSLELSAGSMSEDDINKALIYTLNRYIVESGDKFQLTTLAESYTKTIEDSLHKVSTFRNDMTANNFTLVYQAIVDLKTWQIHHFESLARLKQGGKLLPPSRYIGFAEDFGVIHEFDEMILNKAIHALKTNTEVHKQSIVTVNLSGRSITNPTFVQSLLMTLVENKSLLPRLMFELTETAEVKDLGECNKILQKIRSFGCQVAIDDFGAGAAAFQYLKSLRVDYVKIDGSYIRDAFDTPYGRPFLKAIASLATDMHIKTIGEMVEDNRSMWLLSDLGVDYGQGYFFTRPAESITDFKLHARPSRGDQSMDGAINLHLPNH